MDHRKRTHRALGKIEFSKFTCKHIYHVGALVHARDSVWGQLIFQDLFKQEQ